VGASTFMHFQVYKRVFLVILTHPIFEWLYFFISQPFVTIQMAMDFQLKALQHFCKLQKQ
jgi:hypothetical protein